jgi:uncharacterized protein Yka (UPF0111/DUF47 family)
VATKSLIIEDLGERALLLPQALETALAANDRIKLCFTLLQAAQRHADHPDEPPPELTAELQSARMDAPLQDAVGQSRRETDGRLHVPGAEKLAQLIRDDLTAMRKPLALAETPEAQSLGEREKVLLERLPAFADDRIPAGAIDEMTRARRGASGAQQAAPAIDGLHILVMDLHKALNALQGSLSQELIDGARAWRITDEDRTLLRSFMKGLNETAPLKFNHPGLGTTATRTGNQLVIQNDIGTTDAHVLVLRVEEMTATLTYTDVHAQRLEFFQSLFKPFAVTWTEPSARRNEKFADEPDYRLSVGRFQAQDREALERYLTFLGSRIVFLIDWNHVRKLLRGFLAKGDAVRVLKWAADHNIGHRGFLELGGERLLGEAIEFAQRTPQRYGERLHETLGAEAALEYIKFVLTEAATGLLQGRSERFIRDEIKAELARRFRSAHASLLLIALKHAERVFDLAIVVQEGLLRYSEPQGAEMLQRLAHRARTWEHECDGIVARVRSLARRTTKPEVYVDLLHTADEAADGLEEAAFLMTHLTTLTPQAELIEPLTALCALLVTGAQESVKMFEVASHVTREGAAEDVQDFFAAVDRIVALEHNTDTAERGVTTALLTRSPSATVLYLISALAKALEHSADALALTALKLRDHLLNDVMAG